MTLEEFHISLRQDFSLEDERLAELGEIFRRFLLDSNTSSAAAERVKAIQEFWKEIRPGLPMERQGLPDPGLLKSVGYHCQGLPAEVPEIDRRVVLDYVIAGDVLPPVWSEKYMQEWGAPRSEARFSKLRRSLGSFMGKAACDQSYETAALRWENDRQYVMEIARKMGLWRSVESTVEEEERYLRMRKEMDRKLR